MTLAASVALKIISTLQSDQDLSVRADAINELFSNAFEDGTGANQANKHWSDTRTLATGANETLDLYGGLTDAFGATINFTRIKALVVGSRAANTTILSIGAAAAPVAGIFGDAASDLMKVNPGGIFLITAPDATGIAVTATTADGLKIANASGASATYDIIIIGTV